jgi:predicted molibdopterin-dependent oxidoreductase YjgC
LQGKGEVKAAYVLGNNPLGDLKLYNGTAESLTCLELLVVHEMFLSDTAQLAHVVLPTASFVEIEGTYTNLEGRVQKLNAAISPVPGTAPTIAILMEIANRMGQQLPAQNVAEIFSDLSQNLPAYATLGYTQLGAQGEIRGQLVAAKSE